MKILNTKKPIEERIFEFTSNFTIKIEDLKIRLFNIIDKANKDIEELPQQFNNSDELKNNFTIETWRFRN